MRRSAISTSTSASAPESQVEARLGRDRLDGALVLETVSLGSWRVCDGRIPANGAGRFLAFVEERDGAFEVMQLADEFVWSTFATMRSALTHVVATHAAVSAARPVGDLAWIR